MPPLQRLVRGSVLAVVPLLFLGLACSDAAAQQTGTVTGQVTDALDGRPLSGVQVHFPDLSQGTLTDGSGRYSLQNVPVGEHEIRAERLGYQAGVQSVTVAAGETVTVDIRLESRAITMEGIVATGVAAETPQSQLAFTVARLDVRTQQVPQPTVGGLLRGRVSGAKVVQGSAQPGEEPSFQFRGPTSIMGGQEPLIVVDGVITRGGIADINPQDIESMEVVKGAAAAALYGSRAQAGVLQITTRSGAAMEDGSDSFSFRTTFEANDIERTLGFNTSHWFRMNAAGTEFVDRDGNVVELPTQGGALAFDDGRDGTVGERAFADKPFDGIIGRSYDPMGQFFNPGNRVTSNASVTGNRGGTRYFVSAGVSREEGAIKLNEPMTQYNARLNLTQPIGDNLRLQFNTYISQRERFMIAEQGSFLRQLSFVTAAANLLREDPNDPSGISHIGDPINIANVGPNPVNRLLNTRDKEDRDRFMGGVTVEYDINSWLTIDGNLSLDRIDRHRNRFFRPGIQNLTGPPTVGSVLQSRDLREELNTSVTLAANRTFGDLTMRSRARWLAESQDERFFTASGSGIPVGETPRLGVVTGTPSIDSFDRSVRSEGVFLINSFTYRERYITDFLIRRDGSSLFGADERWQTYWRFSGAWRMSQEDWFPVDWFTEFKPRYSIGTSGGRPRFEAQYQTFAIDAGQVIPRTLGNRDLRPELATEQEFGLDMLIADRFQVELNYVDTRVEDQLLLVPLPSQLGFEAQWRNAGTVEATTWELSLQSALVERPDFVWTARLNLDRTENVISELNTPEFELTMGGSSRSRQMVREGEVFGSYYGFQFLSSCEDLARGGFAGLPCSQFDVNDLGHLVWVGEGNTWRDGVRNDLWGTNGNVGGHSFRWGHPIRPDRDSELGFLKLGDSQPSLNASFFHDIRLGNVGISLLLDGEWGAQVYNFSQQWQCRDGHCALADMRGVPDEEKKPISYFGALQAGNAPNDMFAEDADYIKVRELSLRYTLGEDRLPSRLQNLGLSAATVNLTGRNLKTWTDYRGFDPEVGTGGFGGSAIVGRVDEWFYPNFRSVGLDVRLDF